MTARLAHNDTGEFGGIAGWGVDLMDTLGVLGPAILVALDNVVPPIPSEVVLPLVGFSAADGMFSLAEALLWTTAGSVLGAIIVYYLGRLLGRERTRRLICKLPLVKPADFDKADRWFAKHGTKAVLLGRMVPLVRSFVSLPAGIQRMPFWVFALLTALGSLIWNSTFVVPGYVLGVNWHVVEGFAGVFQIIVAVFAVAAVVLFTVIRLRARRPGNRRRHAGAQADPRMRRA
ncbi:DedA family protein [Prauserella cavernicola]|uniref:DedA family protein n=1 Tax=Prauserella cavernicola TaxID=2800127 RepID=A0A934QZ90_9PSEU|nr:DedA family protein [Prauserella cavernicola]MBK1788003.1 DedA family protein [Prauserella cavernicola]